MDAQQLYTDIQRLPLIAAGIRKKETAAITELQRLYRLVTGQTVYAGCKGCHIKAANYLTSLTINQLETMSEKKFTLNKNVKIEWPFRSGQILTNATLTDEQAAEYLLNNPAGVSNFSEYPKGEDGADLSQWYPEEVAEEKAKLGRKPNVEKED